MTDRYKFRGKRLDNGIWAHGSLVQYYGGNTRIFAGCSLGRPVDPATVGQCTGMRDAKGRLIYEGDIVRYSHPFMGRTGVYEVVYDEHEFTGKGFWITHHDNPGDMLGEGASYLECIGNIHDDPEMLIEKEG